MSSQYLPSHRISSNNFATADRPRCMLRDENYQQRRQRFRKFDYCSEEYEAKNLYWNMNNQPNGNISNAKKPRQKTRNVYEPSSRSAIVSPSSSSSSGFYSFFRWFKKDQDKSRGSKDISYPHDLTSSADTLEYDAVQRSSQASHLRRKLRTFEISEKISPPTTPRLSQNFSQSSSCDSVFSTASSFAFVPPIKYLLNRNQKQTNRTVIDDRSCTDSYRKRINARDQIRELDRRNELTLRKKYQLYGESDAETNNNDTITPNKNNFESSRHYDLSLPSQRTSTDLDNLSDSAKLYDLSLRQHRRTSSDTSNDKEAAFYVHVKGKRKAPPPPLNTVYSHTLTPRSTLGRKKRPAPQPPAVKKIEDATSATSLLEDREIRAIIQGTSSTLSGNFIALSTPSFSLLSEMEKKPKYVSPYLKIREDRKLTDEQKQILIDKVSKIHQKDKSPSLEQIPARVTPDVFTIERGQLVYQGKESPKLPPKEEKLKAPSSPISPRPWYKRSNGNQKDTIPFKRDVILKTMEKRKNKKEKDFSEVGSSRNSIFDGKFNFFSRLNEDSKKKDRDAEKRRSQIGIPNISELDREAAEIIQREHDAIRATTAPEHLMLRSQMYGLKDQIDDDRPKSAKDLISKFEATTTNVNRITLNPAFLTRTENWNETKFSFDTKDITCDSKNANNDSTPKDPLPPKSKLPLPVNGQKKPNEGLMGLWTCPYCTLKNPNWKIICEACEKIKPYDKRYCVNGETNNKAREQLSTTGKTSNDSGKSENWDKKTELVMKYFNPPQNALSKSASETCVGKLPSTKAPSPSRIPGSPQMNLKKNILKISPELSSAKIDIIHEETIEKDEVQVNGTTTVSSPPAEVTQQKEPKKSEILEKSSPNLDEIRSARLARFNLLFNPKTKQSDVEKSNVFTANRKESPDKKISDKLDFSDPAALEREKERLREKIRAMNAKALAEKYPVIKKLPEKNSEQKVESSQNESNEPQTSIKSPVDQSKLGAIKKILRKPLDTRRDSSDSVISEKIINQDKQETEKLCKEKAEKISISVQTKSEPKKGIKKKEDIYSVPTAVKLAEKPKVLTTKQQEEVKEISDQLNSKDGIENFKATLKTSSRYGNVTNTLAINKILRNLENAIADGKYDDAAQFAIDLAKMKVSLSVTRQKDRPRSDIDQDSISFLVDLDIDDGASQRQTKIEISPQMTVTKMKERIYKSHRVAVEVQQIFINGKVANDGSKRLIDFDVSDGMAKIKVLVIREKVPMNKNQTKKKFISNFSSSHESESDDEAQNERVGTLEGAVGGIEPDKLKIEEDGWECPLCTLINLPNRLGCLACSTSRPASYKLPAKYQEIEYKLKVNEDLVTFFEMEKLDAHKPNDKKNDLNRQSSSRKSSDIFNILGDDKIKASELGITQHDPIIMMASITNPNITRNKYRGVDNFSPNKYIFPNSEPSLANIRKPIITSVTYKSSSTCATDQNHYQQLVSLDSSDIVSSVEKFECTICLLEIEPKAGAVLRDCLHIFCKLCLANHVKYCEDAEIKCPFMDNEYSCQSLLQEREIRGLVTRDEYDKHLAQSIRQAENKIENTFHCKTPNCRGWCIFEDNVNTFKCPVCTIVNCLTCRAIHDGLNCKQYQDHLTNDVESEEAKKTKELLQDLIDKDEAMNCPTCHIFLLKKWGCDWLKCSFCKTEICWVTRGPRWGPNGKGDISAGCRCGVNAKKCSPRCTYCH